MKNNLLSTNLFAQFLLIVFFIPFITHYFYTSDCLARSIHIEWGYTPPIEPPVSGFKLYQEDILVCQTNNSIATSMDCDVNIKTYSTVFTLSASFNDGSESPKSEPYIFSIPEIDFSTIDKNLKLYKIQTY